MDAPAHKGDPVIYKSADDVISTWLEKPAGQREELAEMIEDYATQRVQEALGKIVDNSQVKTGAGK